MANLVLNGKSIDSIDDIAENFVEEDVLREFRSGSLSSWLEEYGYEDELERVRSIKPTASNIRVLAGVSEALNLDDDVIAAAAERRAEQQRKEEAARKAREEQQRMDEEECIREKESPEQKQEQEGQGNVEKSQTESVGGTSALIDSCDMFQGHLFVDQEKCIACGVCATSCPNDAIAPIGRESGATYAIDINKCVACGCCKEACPAEAIYEGVEKHSNNISFCCANGEGIAQDLNTDVKWWLKAAEQGDADAQNNLALHYALGEGVAQNWKEAVRWWRKAAEQGAADAQNNLGFRYANGEGVKQNWNEAVRWWRKAAEQGNAEAQCALGYCYQNGLGVSFKAREAIKWYSKAAERGDAQAQFKLGLCYLHGEGVTADEAKALELLHIVAEGESDFAVEAQETISQLQNEGTLQRLNRTIDSTLDGFFGKLFG